jgi:quinol monooxygenase YgiN
MITRIVMLNFQPDRVDEFLEIFNQNKQVLAKSDGCIRLEIFKSTGDTDTYVTISNWQSEEHLEMYRQSELFKEIWSKVKPLFNNKAQAWTLNTLN